MHHGDRSSVSLTKHRSNFEVNSEWKWLHYRTGREFNLGIKEVSRCSPVVFNLLISSDALKSKNGAKSSTVTSYILTTTLPPAYRHPKIIAPSLIGNPEDEAAYIALYTVIVAYIAMSPGGQVPDYKLARMLKRMNAETNVPGGTRTEVALARMERQGYIWKVKENTGDDETTDWRVGPRGKIEIGNRGIQGFVREVFGEDAIEDLDKRLNRSLGIEARVMDPDEEPSTQVNSDPARAVSGRSRRRAADDEDD
jgi:hypothetical protein